MFTTSVDNPFVTSLNSVVPNIRTAHAQEDFWFPRLTRTIEPYLDPAAGTPTYPFETAVTYAQLGVTSDGELNALGTHVNKENLGGGLLKYTYTSAVPGRLNAIITQENGSVQFKSRWRDQTNTEQLMMLSEFENRFTHTGNPPIVEHEIIKPEAVSLGPDQSWRTFVYASKGLAAVADAEPQNYTLFDLRGWGQNVYQIQTFEPTTVAEYLRRWGQPNIYD